MDTQNVREGMLGREIGGRKEKVTLLLDFFFLSNSKGQAKAALECPGSSL